jgi:CRP-like cAMP-binding protein
MVQAPNLDLLFRRIEHSGGKLSAKQRATLATSFGNSRSVPIKSDIIREGDRPTQSTLLLSGLAMRYRFLRNGDRQITAIHLPGDFIDLHSFPLKDMDHSVGTLSQCEIAAIPHSALGEIVRPDPDLTEMLWRLSLLDGAIHREWLVAMGGLPGISHLAHLLCEVYVRLAHIGLAQNLAFDLPVTQVDLGDALGLSPVHVNRVLQDLRGNKVIRFDGKRVLILDWDRLVEIGQFDDKYLHLTITLVSPTGKTEGDNNDAIYYFDFRDGDVVTDDTEGTECEDDQSAKDEAVQALAELARDRLPRSGKRADIAFIVRRADGREMGAAQLTFEVRWGGQYGDSSDRSAL